MVRNATRGKILVVGGGITGITAAIEAAEGGAEVVLVEKSPYLGGRVARTNKYFPKMCPPHCGLEINFRLLRTHPHIRCLTLAEVDKIGGRPGKYEVTVRRKPRYVNNNCTACGDCVNVCPEERPDDFNLGLNKTKAIYLPHAMAYPMQFVIDDSVCPGTECGKCLDACPCNAINLDMKEETEVFEVGAVIMATGWEPYDAKQIEPLGFGSFDNVITNVMMERYASQTGPTGGEIKRPSDGKPIESIAFVQCAGSRDENYLKHCSGVCCMGSLKQARYVREQYPDAKIYVFYIDIRAPGRLERFYAEMQGDEKLIFIKGKVGCISEDPMSKDLIVEAEDALTAHRIKQQVNMVVLATGIVPAQADIPVELDGGMLRDEHGFLTSEQPHRGLLAAGCAKRPVDVASCVRDATGTALKALQICWE